MVEHVGVALTATRFNIANEPLKIGKVIGLARY
jgi:hypothetical protein